MIRWNNIFARVQKKIYALYYAGEFSHDESILIIFAFDI